MAINSPVIALDLDFTLARFQNGYEGIFDVAESFGIARTFAEYQIEIQINCETGFNFERYSNALFPNDTAQSFALCKAFDEHFERNFCWYPEVRDILDKWQKQWIPLIVITAGSQDFQTRKIQQLQFWFDEVFITNITKGKAGVIELLLQKYPGKQLIYVDDKASELEKIQTTEGINISRLKLFQIDYGDSPDRLPIASWIQFQKISSLNEIYR